MKIRWTIGLFLLTGVTVSCAKTSSVVIPNSYVATNHHFILHEKLKTIFPEKGRFSARVTVTFVGKEMDLITYTVLNGTDIRSKAMGEFGGTLFDFLYVNGEILLLTFPEQFPETTVRKGPAEDLYHLFYISRKKTSIDACGDNCVLISFEDNIRHLFEFSPEDVLLRSIAYLNQKPIREVRYSDWKFFSSWGKAVPGKITLIHHDPDYGMDIDILDLASGISNMEAFKRPENTR